jgi:hypothetical protein|tara:strand:+ start:591 stop:881 length:291 start_codon:yes stop_codon:yes gene_type:complete
MIGTQEIIDICVENSYNLLTGKKSIEDILDSSSRPYFLWNVVEEELDQEIFDGFIDFMINYYEEMEYYERCSVLLNIKLNERNKCKQENREINRVG